MRIVQVVRTGGTRIVILIGPLAFKVARIRLVSPFRHLLARYAAWKDEGVVAEKVAEKMAAARWNIIHHFFPGIFYNREEWRLYRERKDGPFIPTYLCFFGLLNVQARGEPVTKEELAAKHPFAHLSQPHRHSIDVDAAEQYCLWRGRVVLADYGHHELRAHFASHAQPYLLQSA